MRDEILAAWERVYDSGRYVLGPELEAFEREFAEFTNAQHCIGVSSGTDALTLILRALGVQGKEVLVPAITFIATAEAVVLAGAVPVFTDVDPGSWLMTPDTAQGQITEKTAAIIPVHFSGRRAPFIGRDYWGIPIVEDACQAAGLRHHTGMAAAYSFYPSKQLAGLGDGGAVVTDDVFLDATLRRLRSHGASDNRTHEQIGTTARLDELQAAALRIRLRDFQAKRQEIDPREAYSMPCHLQPSMRPYYRGPLPNTEALFSRGAVCA